MDRRTFMITAGGNVGAAYLCLHGCTRADKSAVAELRPGTGGVPGVHGVGEDHLIFDADSVEFELEPHDHHIVDLDARGAAEGRFGRLGQDRGELNFPVAGVVGPDGRLYVLDNGNSRVEIFDKRRRRVGGFGSHGSGQDQLNHASDIAVGPKGNLYVADTFNHRVQVYTPNGKWVRSIGRFGEGKKSLNAPRSVAITPNGELHVADSGHARVQVYALDGEHQGSYGEFGDGPGEVLSLSSIVCDSEGRVSVADPSGGHVHVFRDGEFVGRFRPRDKQGDAYHPVRLQLAPGDKLYVWTAGYGANPTS